MTLCNKAEMRSCLHENVKNFSFLFQFQDQFQFSNKDYKMAANETWAVGESMVHLLQSLVAYFFVFNLSAVKVYLFLQMLARLQKNEDILMFGFGW